jgi:hypothetical protein
MMMEMVEEKEAKNGRMPEEMKKNEERKTEEDMTGSSDSRRENARRKRLEESVPEQINESGLDAVPPGAYCASIQQ